MARAYYFRGLDNISLNQKQAGCNDLQMATNLGHQFAPSQYQKYCLNNVKNGVNKTRQTKIKNKDK